MLNSHFLGSCVVNGDDHDIIRTNPSSGTNKEKIFALSKQIFIRPKTDWAISIFNPNKASGEDGIFPGLIQQAKDILLTPLCYIFTTYLILGYIPQSWTKVKVIFIPKSGKKDKTQPKAYRPISLTSTLLKIMEKILDDFCLPH